MAARFKTTLYTLTASPVSLETILNSAPDTFVSSVTLRAGATNGGSLFWRDSATGANGGYLEPREAASFDLSGKFIRSSDFFLYGTAGDTVYITVMS